MPEPSDKPNPECEDDAVDLEKQTVGGDVGGTDDANDANDADDADDASVDLNASTLDQAGTDSGTQEGSPEPAAPADEPSDTARAWKASEPAEPGDPSVDLNAATLGGAGSLDETPSVDRGPMPSDADLNAATLGGPAAEGAGGETVTDAPPSEDVGRIPTRRMRASEPGEPEDPSVALNAATSSGPARPSSEAATDQSGDNGADVDLNAATLGGPAGGEESGVDLNAATLGGGETPDADLTAATLGGAEESDVALNAATVGGASQVDQESPTFAGKGSADLDEPTIDDDVKSHWAATITEDVTEGMTIKGEDREGKDGRPRQPVAIATSKSTHITVHTRSVVDKSAKPAADLTIGERTVDRGRGAEGVSEPDYELLGMLGEGGMGVIYKARQSSIDRNIAVKMIKEQAATDKTARGKFLSEAAVTGDLDHPNIVPIHDLGDDGRGHLFYSMKHVKGKPWDEVILDKSLAENLEILEDVCNAVAFAHDHGVLHRDLKPENVMLGGYGEVLVMDWGLAAGFTDKAKAPRLTPKTGVCGTPAYMSPEMAVGQGNRIGPVSDVYLLGAILFEIVTGFAPHTGATVIKCLENAAKNEIRETEKQSELLDIARRAMATKPTDRYAGVPEFQTAISEYKSHFESISLADRARKDLEDADESREYEDYSRSIFGFQEALNLWRKNRGAAEGLSQARLAYARCAMAKADLDLAESQLVEMTEPFRKLRNEVVDARIEREKRHRLLTIAKYAVATLLTIVLVGGSIAGYYIHLKRLEAEEERQRAIEEKREADVAKQIAENERVEAEKQKRAAEKARQDAEQEREAAEKERERAKQEEQKAKAALARAEREQLLKRQAQAREAKLKEQRFALSEELAKEKQKESADAHGLPMKRLVPLPGEGVTLPLVLIPEGRFTMGSHPDEKHRDASESLHDVEISRPFYMGATEVTRAQWKAVVGRPAPTAFAKQRILTSRFPVENVSFDEIQEVFLPALQKHAPEGFRFDLPTEAEWEYAARAGSPHAYHVRKADDEQSYDEYVKDLDAHAWYAGNARNHPEATARKQPNAWGLYDMHGNVAEWCKDVFESDYYMTVAEEVLERSQAEVDALREQHPDMSEEELSAKLTTPPLAVDPINAKEGRALPRVVRGGSYMFLPDALRCAHRRDARSDNRYRYLGLRVVLRPVPQP